MQELRAPRKARDESHAQIPKGFPSHSARYQHPYRATSCTPSCPLPISLMSPPRPLPLKLHPHHLPGLQNSLGFTCILLSVSAHNALLQNTHVAPSLTPSTSLLVRLPPATLTRTHSRPRPARHMPSPCSFSPQHCLLFGILCVYWIILLSFLTKGQGLLACCICLHAIRHTTGT